MEATGFVQHRNDDGDGHRAGEHLSWMRAARGHLGGRFGVLEHEIHHDGDGGPEDHLLMPEQDFAVVKKGQTDGNRSGHQGIADGRIFHDRVSPDGDAAEVNQERDDVNFKSTADGKKHVQKPMNIKAVPIIIPKTCACRSSVLSSSGRCGGGQDGRVEGSGRSLGGGMFRP